MHVLHALIYIMLEKHIPRPTLEKHLRRLEADELQESMANTKKRASDLRASQRKSELYNGFPMSGMFQGRFDESEVLPMHLIKPSQ